MEFYKGIIQGRIGLKSTWIYRFVLKSLWNQICLEKYLKTLKSLEKSLNFTILNNIGGFNTVFGDLNKYKIVVLSFGAAQAAPNKGTTILYTFSKIYIFSNAV